MRLNRRACACSTTGPFLLAGLSLSLAVGALAAPSLTDTNIHAERVASGLVFPTSMEFLGQDDFLILEKNTGRVFRVVSGTPGPTPVLDVAAGGAGQQGLFGIAINTESPPKVFISYSEAADPDGDGQPDDGAPLGNRVYRYTWNAAEQKLEARQLVLDLPVIDTSSNNGGVLLLGPTPTPGGTPLPGDGSLLYVLMGDLNQTGQLRNLKTGVPPDDMGVILRVNQDGSPATGNPFTPYCSTTTTTVCASDDQCPGGESCFTQVARYFAYGVRNGFGLTLDPATGNLWDTENGDSSYDEVNRVPAGMNSGWRPVQGPRSRTSVDLDDLFDMPGSSSTYGDPEFSWRETIAPTGILFLAGSALGSSYDDSVLVGDYLEGAIYRFRLSEPLRTSFVLAGGLADKVADSTAEKDSVRVGTGFGAVTCLKQGPDGLVYVVNISDGEVWRIAPGTPFPTATPTPTRTRTATPTRTGSPTPTVTPTPPTAPSSSGSSSVALAGAVVLVTLLLSALPKRRA